MVPLKSEDIGPLSSTLAFAHSFVPSGTEGEQAGEQAGVNDLCSRPSPCPF